MLSLDKSDGTGGEAIGGEEGKRVCQGKVEVEPTLDDAGEGGDGAKDWSIGGADKKLLFTFVFVLLLAPADGGSDDVRDVGESLQEG